MKSLRFQLVRLAAEVKESFLMAMGALAAHKLRSALTLLGVLVGVFVEVFVKLGVLVGVRVGVEVMLGVLVKLGVLVGVLVNVGMLVGVRVGVLVGQAFIVNGRNRCSSKNEPTPAVTPPVLHISPPARPVL